MELQATKPFVPLFQPLDDDVILVLVTDEFTWILGRYSITYLRSFTIFATAILVIDLVVIALVVVLVVVLVVGLVVVVLVVGLVVVDLVVVVLVVGLTVVVLVGHVVGLGVVVLTVGLVVHLVVGLVVVVVREYLIVENDL